MVYVAIYYRMSKAEIQDNAIDKINKLIQCLEDHHVSIKEVFIDEYDRRDQFEKLIKLPLNEVDYIYINKMLLDEFDNNLINELAKSEQFEIKLFSEV